MTTPLDGPTARMSTRGGTGTAAPTARRRPARAGLAVIGLGALGALLSLGATSPVDDATAGTVWLWPVDEAHVVVRPYVAPATEYGAGHRGVDIAAGDDLLAPADGVVSFAGVVVDRGVLSIDHGDGVVSSYEPVTTDLVAGDAVRAGDVIATIDRGHCADPCVHMGVRLDGEYVSPMLYLGGVPRAVLLPTRRLG